MGIGFGLLCIVLDFGQGLGSDGFWVGLSRDGFWTGLGRDGFWA